jgi:hypothetical protein
MAVEFGANIDPGAATLPGCFARQVAPESVRR